MASRLISNTASEVLPANASRKSLSIQNEDGTQIVYIKREAGQLLTASATDHDFKLNPNTGVTLSSQSDGTQAIQARYTAVADANTPRIAWFESEDIQR